MSNRQGITLIEVMIVVLLAAVVVTMIVWVVPVVRERGRRAQCLRQLGCFDMAIASYMLDSGEHVPAHLVDCPAVSPKLFICPSDVTRTNAAEVSNISSSPDKYSSYAYWPTSYGTNLSQTSGGPGYLMVLCDKNADKPLSPEPSGFGRNHGGSGGNILYSDHSARWVKIGNWRQKSWGTNWAGLGEMSEF